MASRTRTRKTDDAPKGDEQQQEKGEKIPFTPEERVTYFETKLAYWNGKLGRLIHKPKIAHAKKRVEHYAAKLAEAQEKLA